MSGLILVSFIPTFYAVDLGLGLGLVGLVFMAGRLLDIVTDPLIGYLSDQTRSRLGARRPWMILSLPFYAGAVWILLVPPESVTLLYLIAASTLYFLFYTAIDVPYSAVGLEYSSHTHERSVLATTKAIFQIIGAVAASLIPLIVVGDMSDALRRSALIIIGLGALFLALFLRGMPRVPPLEYAERTPFFTQVRDGFGNPAYRIMIISFGAVQTANALTAALLVLYATHILKNPGVASMVLGLIFVASALFLPVWVWLSVRTSKARTWRIAIVSGAVILFLFMFINEGDVFEVLGLSVLLGACFGADAIMPTSILADIVYVDDAKAQNRTGGTYLAFKNAVSKSAFIAPMGIAFPVLDWVGFKTEDGAVNSMSDTYMLLFFFILLPVTLRLVGYGTARRIPDLAPATRSNDN